jgi:hypothetical protein
MGTHRRCSVMSLNFAPGHPLAAVAAWRCHGHLSPVVGGVACGSCWEQAIRDDERFAVESELPRELHTDPELIDEVAIERAMRGIPVRLTVAERTAAIAALSSRGMTPARIARFLDTAASTVGREIAQLKHANAGSAAA